MDIKTNAARINCMTLYKVAPFMITQYVIVREDKYLMRPVEVLRSRIIETPARIRSL